jgi:hypothetical protein
LRYRDGSFGRSSLPLKFSETAYRYTYTPETNAKEQQVGKILRRKQTTEIAWRVCLGIVALYGGSILLYYTSSHSTRRRRWWVSGIAIALIAAGLAAFLFAVYWQPYCEQNPYCQYSLPHNSIIVPQKYLDTL